MSGSPFDADQCVTERDPNHRVVVLLFGEMLKGVECGGVVACAQGHDDLVLGLPSSRVGDLGFQGAE
jgi:hypothetical protein